MGRGCCRLLFLWLGLGDRKSLSVDACWTPLDACCSSRGCLCFCISIALSLLDTPLLDSSLGLFIFRDADDDTTCWGYSFLDAAAAAVLSFSCGATALLFFLTSCDIPLLSACERIKSSSSSFREADGENGTPWSFSCCNSSLSDIDSWHSSGVMAPWVAATTGSWSSSMPFLVHRTQRLWLWWLGAKRSRCLVGITLTVLGGWLL